MNIPAGAGAERRRGPLGGGTAQAKVKRLETNSLGEQAAARGVVRRGF